MIIFNNDVDCTLRSPEGAPSGQGSAPDPFPAGQPGGLGRPVFPGPAAAQVRSVTVGSRPEGEEGGQVSPTTLPPSSLGRGWPGLRYHMTEREEPSGLSRVSRPSSGRGRWKTSVPSAASYAHCPLGPPRFAIATAPVAHSQLPGHRSAGELSLPAFVWVPSFQKLEESPSDATVLLFVKVWPGHRATTGDATAPRASNSGVSAPAV